MEGVLADLAKGANQHIDGNRPEYLTNPDDIPGVFRNLPPIEGAVEAVNEYLNCDGFDVYILTTAPWDNPSAFCE